MSIIDKFSVVEDYRKGIWILCENKNLQSVMESIGSKNNEGLPDYKKLEYCVSSTSGWLDRGREIIIEGKRFGSITIEEYDCLEELENNFDEYVTKEEIETLLTEDVCFRDFLWNKIDNVIFRNLMVKELEEMLELAKIKDYNM